IAGSPPIPGGDGGAGGAGGVGSPGGAGGAGIPGRMGAPIGAIGIGGIIEASIGPAPIPGGGGTKASFCNLSLRAFSFS
ncbi:MAG: hypothetical protein GTO54_09565, partial [Nitrososphaeria archaeon]|nr:hypothetical protein [Nitrososphaeria archaeon]